MSAPQADQDGWRENPEDAPVVSTTFLPTEVRIITTDPPRYEFDIDEKTVTMSHLDLVKRDAFQARCLAVLHRMVDVPRGKSAAEVWQFRVNLWLASAKRIDTADEASPVVFERQAVAECLDNLSVAAEEVGAAQDFRRGCVVVREDKAHVHLRAVLERMRPDFPKMGSDDLADHLRKLKWAPSSVRIEGTASRRSWAAPRDVWQSMAWAAQIRFPGEDG